MSLEIISPAQAREKYRHILEALNASRDSSIEPGSYAVGGLIAESDDD